MAKRHPRLSVAQCDSVGKASGISRDEASAAYEALITKLKEEHPDKELVEIKSKTDQDRQRRRSFAEKDVSNKLEVIKGKNLGVCCKKGMKPEAPNQDSFMLLIVEGVFALYGVFDGHGPFGHDVSDQARDVLVVEFMNHPERTTNSKKAFEESFPKTQEILKASFKPTEIAVSGSTCSMAYHDMQQRSVTVAHIGDSRAVMGMQVKTGTYERFEELTVDHKPELPEEKKRIESQGGRVEFDGFYNYRVFAKASQSPGLNMSRAFGDVYAHTSAGLTAMPDVREIQLSDHAGKYERITLLLCSDGVWEFIDSETVKVIVQKGIEKGPQEAASDLATESYKRWMDDSGNEVADDITVVLAEINLS